MEGVKNRPTRRMCPVVHVAASAAQLGLSPGLLTLGVTAAATGSEPAGSERAMKLFADWLMLPVALLTLAGGLVPALGTEWGLTRHR